MTRRTSPLTASARLMTRLLPLSLAVLLAACGGSSGGSSSPTSTSAISGTAATGNPISSSAMSAVVTLKDSGGKTVTTTTDASGHYSFTPSQISGFTAPFMLEVSYQVGGVSYTLHSAVTAADVASGNATVNITPLTELVVANNIGEYAAEFFATGNFSGKLTAAGLKTSTSAVNAIIAGLVTQLGLSPSPDLLHAGFTANGSGLDSLLDALKISIDPSSGSVSITNTLNGNSVTGTVSNLPATPVSTTGSASASDIQAINFTFQAYAAVIATNPAASSSKVTALFGGTSFLHNGLSLSDFLTNLLDGAGGDSSLTFTDITLLPVPAYATSAVPQASLSSAHLVRFTVLQDKLPIGTEEFVMYKGTGTAGLWIALGNQRKAEVDLQTIAISNLGSTCTGLNLGLFSSNSSLASINYATITGAGLPQDGLLLYKNSQGFFTLAAGGASSYQGTSTVAATHPCTFQNVYATTDNTIASLSLSSDYSIALHSVDNSNNDTTVATYKQRLSALPFTSSQLANGVFPSNVTASSSVISSAAKATPTAVTVNWTAPTVAGELAQYLQIYINGSSQSNAASSNLSPTANKVTLTPPAVAGASSDSTTLVYTDRFLRTINYTPSITNL